jgi:ABC-type uncharacterized transport system permease subunit
MPLSLIGGLIAAGAYAFVPAYLKARRGMNEVLICMLMNYVAIYLLGTAVNSFLKAPNQPDPKSVMLSKEAWFSKLPGTHLHTGFFLVFIAAAILYFVLFHTSWGYQLRSVGLNTKASTYGGISVTRTMITSMVISGILAGFAGSLTILGTQHRLYANFMINYGYDAVPVAMLGGLNPLGVLATAFLFGALKNGGNAMQISSGIPVSIVSMVNAIAILSIIAITQIKALYLSKAKRGQKNERLDFRFNILGCIFDRHYSNDYSHTAFRVGRCILRTYRRVEYRQEGMMLIGAFVAFLGAYYSNNNPYMGFLISMLSGMIVGAIYAIFVVTLGCNQIVTALGINMFGLGVPRLSTSTCSVLRQPYRTRRICLRCSSVRACSFTWRCCSFRSPIS